MDMPTFHALWTAALLVIFIGIVWWAFGSRQQRRFHSASQIPLEDDDDGENITQSSQKEQHHA